MPRFQTLLVTGFTALCTVAIGVANHGLAARSESGDPAAQAGFGTIKGRVVWDSNDIPPRIEITANKKTNPEVCAKTTLYERELEVDPQTKGVANVFVYLPTPTGANPELVKALIAETPEVEIDQINCEFIPVSTALHKDQTVVFKSSDPIGHNVHYIGFTNNANFALGPNGSSKKKLAAEKRPINLVCDIHPWMKGNLMVFSHPFFAVTAEDGSFEIRGVPAGTQNLVAWQRKAGYVTDGGNRGIAVTVKDGETVDLGPIKLDPAKIKK